MATKSALISAVNGFLTSVVTILKHRNSMLEVINEGYNSPVNDNSTNETYTTKPEFITYTVQFNKAFRQVRVNGQYTNILATALPLGTIIFTLKDNEFKGSTSEFIGIGANYVPFTLVSNAVIPPNATVKFSVTYNANN
jgi:hypothetical protein